MFDDVCTLIAVRQEKNEYGVDIPIETRTRVHCKISSVSGREANEAGQRTIVARYRIEMYRAEYNNQKLVEISEGRFSIYRPYISPKRMDIIELYLEERAGNGQ